MLYDGPWHQKKEWASFPIPVDKSTMYNTNIKLLKKYAIRYSFAYQEKGQRKQN